VIEKLRGLILRGVYGPGQKLPPERQLAAELGVNRSSLREALKRLDQLGLVRSRQGDGTRVLDFMQTAGFELVRHLVERGSPEILRDVLEFRRIYAREVARLAAERADEQDFTRLEQLAAELPAGAPAEDTLRLDFEFYTALTEIARNTVFRLLINTIRGAVLTYGRFFAGLTGDADAVRRHHRAMIKALRARGGDQAAALADQHTRRALRAASVEGHAPA
jgi:GntR family transcriptional repressor for pyruvate dehydrogenase complex